MKIKRVIVKTLFFICFTILSMTIYYKIIPIINVYGIEAFYKKDYTETESFQTIFETQIMSIEDSIYNGVKIDSYNPDAFSYANRHPNNVKYIADIEKTNGEKMILSNFVNSTGEPYNGEQIQEEIYNFKDNMIYYICRLNYFPETSEQALKYYQFHADQEVFSRLDIYICIQDFKDSDWIAGLKQNYEDFIYHYHVLITICAILSILCIIMLVYLTKHIENKTTCFDSMYFEEIILIITLLVMLAIGMVFGNSSLYNINNISKFLIYLVSYFSVLEIYFTFVKKVKLKKYRKGNFITPKILENMKYIHKPIVIFVTLCLVDIYFTQLREYYTAKYDQVIILGLYTMILLHYLNIRIELLEINKKTKEISKGNFNVKLDKRNNIYNDIVNNINNIQITNKEAIEEKLKSERLKTDLITNVSHDLKTPLTSIINYTNLLKKEKIESENAKKYIEILEQKSKKLKYLTEDLIEISKISSGNEKVELERLNFAEMVLQANGEFAERFEGKGLNLISNIEADEMIANLDSKKMFRVLENIYSNIYKYSLENTRVYVALQRKEDKIEFSIKNISKDELNISPDELMQRFVRGDKSRNSNGNGLGLSISKDLVTLQGGMFDINIEGDLFMVKIII